jgi:tetratricopeptide (TPR) repeat protein
VRHASPRSDRSKEEIRRSVIAAILVLLLSSASLAGEVDVGALPKESEEAVEKLNLSADKSELLIDLARFYAKRGDRQQALKMLGRAVKVMVESPRKAGTDPGGVVPILVEVQASLGDVAGALKSAKTLNLSVFGRIEVAKGQAEAGDIAGAWATCDRLDPEMGAGKMKALYEVVGALAETGRFDGALQTVDRIEKFAAKLGPTRDFTRATYNTCLLAIASEQAKRGQAKDALRTSERMDDDMLKVTALQEIATNQLWSGDQAGAREAVQRALPIFKRHNDFDQTLFGEMVATQAHAGDVPGALKTTTMFLKGSVKGAVLLQISIVQAKSGDRNAATQTFNEGFGLVKMEKNTLNSVAFKQAEAGEFDRAIELARLVDDPGEVLREVAVGLAKRGDIPRAMKVAASIPADSGEQSTAFRQIASAQAKARQPSAKLTFARAVDAAMSEKKEAALSLREIGRAQLRASYVKAAAKTFDTARGRAIVDKLNSSQLQGIADAQAAGGDPSGALSWARSQSSPLLKARSLVGVIQGLTEGPQGVHR